MDNWCIEFHRWFERKCLACKESVQLIANLDSRSLANNLYIKLSLFHLGKCLDDISRAPHCLCLLQRNQALFQSLRMYLVDNSILLDICLYLQVNHYLHRRKFLQYTSVRLAYSLSQQMASPYQLDSKFFCSINWVYNTLLS